MDNNEQETTKANSPEPAAKSETPAPARKTGKLASLRNDPKGWLVLLLGVGAPLAFVIAAGGSGIGLWGWQAGLGAVPWIVGAALLALIITIVGIVLDKRKGRKTRWPLLGLGTAATLGFFVYLMGYISPMLSLPAIHDITTDLADPPQFQSLTLREDNWDNIPGADDGDMRGMNPRQRWATLHQEAFPDIRSVRIDRPVAEVIEKAKRLAEDRGWEIVSVDPAAGRLEATDTVSLFPLQGRCCSAGAGYRKWRGEYYRHALGQPGWCP